MSDEARLAVLVTALEELGIAFLVMGGHAVRYYYADKKDAHR